MAGSSYADSETSQEHSCPQHVAVHNWECPKVMDFSIEVKIGIHHENGLFVVFESEILTVFVRSGSYLGENIPDRFHEFHEGLRFQSILKRCKEIARGTSV